MGVKTAIFVLAALIGICKAIPQTGGKSKISASCIAYTSTDLNGYTREIRDYVEDLRSYSLDNSISSALVNGIWLFYTEFKYNGRNLGGGSSYFGWGKNLRISTFGNLNREFSSLRYSGVGENMKQNTINFYEGAGFMGNEEYHYSDSSYLNYDNFGKSIIITGCEPWTLYEDRHYRGEHICLYPSSTQNCEPGFYLEPKDFGYFANKVSSIRRGCYSKKVFKGISIPANTTRMFSAQ